VLKTSVIENGWGVLAFITAGFDSLQVNAYFITDGFSGFSKHKRFSHAFHTPNIPKLLEDILPLKRKDNTIPYFSSSGVCDDPEGITLSLLISIVSVIIFYQT
jgi:hypothetical protein